MACMRVVDESELVQRLSQLLDRTRRVVVAGNFAPWRAAVADRCLPTYRLWTLTRPAGAVDREGVVHETRSSARGCARASGQ